jgi:putative N-acetyltransferase (TIGR04045 family)
VNTVHALPGVDNPVDARRELSDQVICVEARSDDELRMHHRIRHAVFVQEQAVFSESDVDAHDSWDDVIRVVAHKAGKPNGAERLYPVDDQSGLWKGDRLAVLPDCRTHGVGAPLVRFAVAHAGAHGGRRMIAHVQVPNVRFFERLGWSACQDPEEYLGLMHQLMDIPLIGA